jgi:Fe-S cluster assembly protein SufD
VHCDDSINQQSSFSNSVTEIFVEENANLDHYKLQNLNNDSTLINSTFVHQKSGSNASTNSITLNGGLIRNNTFVKLNGQMCDANVYGVYLMDKTQHIDNHVFIDHAEPNCSSNELFKGILDEDATGVFNGHILVRRDAQKTRAFQLQLILSRFLRFMLMMLNAVMEQL